MERLKLRMHIQWPPPTKNKKDIGMFRCHMIEIYKKTTKIVYYFRYDVRYGIKNLFKYFKLIWNDRDWDFVYFLQMIEFKLKNIRIDQSGSNHTNSDQHIAIIDEAILLCNKILEDNYEPNDSPNIQEDTEKLFELIGGDVLSWWS